MSQNKRKKHTDYYFDPSVLKMKQNELQAMLHDANQLIKRIYETHECGNSGCDARCRYNAICEAAHMTYKLIKRQVDLYDIKES